MMDLDNKPNYPVTSSGDCPLPDAPYQLRRSAVPPWDTLSVCCRQRKMHLVKERLEKRSMLYGVHTPRSIQSWRFPLQHLDAQL